MKELKAILIGAAALGVAAAIAIYYLQKSELVGFETDFEREEAEEPEDFPDAESLRETSAKDKREASRRKSVFFEPLEIVNRQLSASGAADLEDEGEELAFGEVCFR